MTVFKNIIIITNLYLFAACSSTKALKSKNKLSIVKQTNKSAVISTKSLPNYKRQQSLKFQAKIIKFLKENDLPSAYTYLIFGLNNEKENTELLNLLGIYYFQKGEAKKAYSVFKKINHPHSFYNLSLTLINFFHFKKVNELLSQINLDHSKDFIAKIKKLIEYKKKNPKINITNFFYNL